VSVYLLYIQEPKMVESEYGFTTTIGPLAPKVRNRVRNYRDENGHESYNEAVAALLEEGNTDL
jgi:hypothetical protein